MEYSVNLSRIVSDYDAKLHYIDFWDPQCRDSLDGIVVRHHSRFHIWVNERLWEYEKQRTAMHEIAHIDTWTVWVVGSLICERMCDEWAIDHMIPDDKLREAVEYYGEDCDFLPQLFGVSIENMNKKCSKI